MCKRVSLAHAIECGLFDSSYAAYFEFRGKPPESVTIAVLFYKPHGTYAIEDPKDHSYKSISQEMYEKLIYPTKRKFPGRKTK
ncbi:MAG: hypothetical protein QXM68_04160 [Candidatus Aenigmatarchaeota archaeon]|nr:hypothetical protein [Candidatus Aenigmarchaeota archaeon]